MGMKSKVVTWVKKFNTKVLNSVFGINISTMTFAGSAQDIKISGQIYNLQL